MLHETKQKMQALSGMRSTDWKSSLNGRQSISSHHIMSSFKDWSRETWNGGCPVNVMVPGAVINYGDCLREPFHR